MKLQSELEVLGFTKNEALVYIALAELGLTQTGPLIEKTKLHRMLVYNALKGLVDSGYAKEVRKKSVRLFEISNPKMLLERGARMKKIAEEVSEYIDKVRGNKEASVDVSTLIGREGYIKNLEEVVSSAALHQDKEMCIIGGARDKDFYEAIGDWYGPYTRLLKRNGVKKRLLAPASFSEEFRKRFASEENTQLRVLPKGLSSPIYTRITNSMVTIEMYKPAVVVIQIRSEVVAKGYLESFELLWKLAK